MWLAKVGCKLNSVELCSSLFLLIFKQVLHAVHLAIFGQVWLQVSGGNFIFNQWIFYMTFILIAKLMPIAAFNVSKSVPSD